MDFTSNFRGSRGRVLTVCVLLVLLLLAELHVHSDQFAVDARRCPTCISIHCAMLVAVTLLLLGHVLRARTVSCDIEPHFSPLLTADLFIRPPPLG